MLLIFGLFAFSFYRTGYQWHLASVWAYRAKFISGFKMTLVLSVCSLAVSLVIGLLVAVLRQSRFLFLQYLSRIYVELIRGTPLLVQILVFFYIVGTALGLSNRYAMGILILSLFSGAYVSEILRAGLQSIGAAQLETAKSLGFTDAQTAVYIILPQMVKTVLPPLTGQFANVVKDSSLLSVIAVAEFTKNVQEVDTLTFAAMENYLFLALGYLIITLPISLLSKVLEKRMHYEA